MWFAHAAVMVQEVANLLQPETGRRYLDGTVGGGGHAERILIDSSPEGKVLGLDRDDEAVVAAGERLHVFGDRVIVRQGNFSAATEILEEIGWGLVDGVVLDLGVSSHQLESKERGFSFLANARLDMRMDRRQSLDAAAIVNSFSVAELERILRDYGEERQARRIALALESERKTKPLETTEQLARLIERIKGSRRGGRHPATQAFQALRIAVNDELQHLERFLEDGYQLLSPKGRMVIISFQSLEDRLVKTAFRKWNRDCLCPPKAPTCRCGWTRKAKLLTKRPMGPSPSEIKTNPRARSAKLRAVERI
jgi:16S rRNA (cytosine1402-N4)-methyltransferase